jgi:hypothetical protein
VPIMHGSLSLRSPALCFGLVCLQPTSNHESPTASLCGRSFRSAAGPSARRRESETSSARRQRIENYRKQREENGALLLDFPNAFTFRLLRDDTKNGHPALVLSATPRPRIGPLSRAAKVLSGMQGTLWIDKDTFHIIRAECEVVTPVPLNGILAEVQPGTHILFEMAHVSDSVWLVSEFSMTLEASKLFCSDPPR